MFQTLCSLIPSIRNRKGCLHFDLMYSTEDENQFLLLAGWQTQDDLDSYLQSDLFKILLGAMDLLERTHEIRLYAGLPGNAQIGGHNANGGSVGSTV